MKPYHSAWILVSLGVLGLALLIDRTRCSAQIAEPGERLTKPRGPSLDERLLFFPTKFPHGNWQPQKLKFHDVFFAASDGTKLHAWYCPSEQPQGVLLFAHGNAGNIATRVSWLEYLQREAKLSILAFDYRGFGRSEGKPTVEGVLDDARAARDKLRELATVEDRQIIFMGESLGGAVMVHLAAETPPRGLILQSTFSSLRAVADVHYSKLSWVVPREKLNSVRQIARYRGPLLQSHGQADRTIPIELGQALYQAANEPKQFVTIAEADHDNWLTADYVRQFEAFISQLPPVK